MISSQSPQSPAEFALSGVTGTLTLELTGLVDPQLMVPDLEADSKLGAIKLLVDRLHQRGVVDDSLSFLQSVLERENLMSTVLDGEVALPHARSRSVRRLGLALGVCERPIDFPSGDDRCGVRLICLIAVPVDTPGRYLGLLAALAGAFSDNDVKRKLLEAGSSDSMHRLMTSRLDGAAL